MTLLRALMAASAAAVIAAGAVPSCLAQQPTSLPAQPTNQTGWMFNVAPYIWLPSVNGTAIYNLPPALGGRLSTEISSGPGDYFPNLKFAGMVAADAEHGPWSVLTDLMYVNASVNQTSIRSLDFFGLPSRPISRSVQLGASTTLRATIWTLAGGYSVLRGPWGDFTLLAGFRYAGIDAKTDYDLALSVTGPRGNGATFGGPGSISGNTNIWNGIAGFRGRIRVSDVGLFVPYYFDIGAGGSDLTWQFASGLGYQTGWASVSALYRYLAFDQGSHATLKHLSLGGPLIMVTFRF